MPRNRSWSFLVRVGRIFALALHFSFALCAGGVAHAETMNEAEAHSLVDSYLDAHNRHQLELTMSHYSDDAVFQLNGGRPAVQGRDAIRELERFDVLAVSTVQPHGLAFDRVDGGWTVNIAGVVENSAVFAALGMTVVRAEAVRGGFTLAGGKIVKVVQPELKPACVRIALSGFSRLAMWLAETQNPLAPELLRQGRIDLTPGRVPLLISALENWRATTGWYPDPAEVRDCALP